jgi:type IV pilus assembly protein PilO
MKISRSEKILLAILASIIIVLGYHNFVFKKQLNHIEAISKEKDQLREKLDNIKLTIATSTKRQNDIKILNSKIHDAVDRLYPAIWQEKALIELNDLLSKSKLEGTGNASSNSNGSDSKKVTSSSNSTDSNKTNNTEASYANVLGAVEQYNTQVLSMKKEDVEAIYKNSYTSMTATLSFKGTYDNVYALISNIENYNRKIYISNLNLAGTNNEVTGTASLEFLSVPKFADTDMDYFKWDYNNKYGKQNPFPAALTTGAKVNTTIEQASKPQENVKDFSMAVRSVNSDLPALMLGKYNDTERKSYIYADSNKVENVEVYFTEQNGKYYYKYKTDQSSYPQQYEGNGIEFKPSGSNISIAVFSNKRLSDTDMVGVNLRVINKTSKTVEVLVSNDDSKPRIALVGEGNPVNLKKQ